MRLYFRRGQSILEYVVLIALILSSLLIMQAYVKRAYQGRLKREADAMGQQYAPGHTRSTITSHVVSSSSTGNSGGPSKTDSNTTTTYQKWETVDSFIKTF